jgi:SAM-dependent methyltransferase/uncharacterized protein YbaR (Trm112 family)
LEEIVVDDKWARSEETIHKALLKHGLKPPEDYYRPAVDFARLLLSGMPREQRDSISLAMLEFVENNANRLFGLVNAERGTSPDRQQTFDEIHKRLADRGARHLEMGVHIGFPDSRVESLIRERKLGEFLRLDLDPKVRPDVVADCARLPFLDGSLDSVASDSLFEHMRFPHETIRETFRVLAPGGVMQINTPFFFTIHNYPGDYMRLTPQFLEETCREVGFERVYCHVYDFGGLYYTLHNSCKAVSVDETQESSVVKSAKKIHLNLTILLMLATGFDSLFYGHARNFFIGVYCVAFKAGEAPHRPSLGYSGHDGILDRMLPYLACPVSHERIFLTVPDCLATSDGKFVYPVRDGIPMLVPKVASSVVHQAIPASRLENEQTELQELREFRDVILASGSYRLARRISALMRSSPLKRLGGAVPSRVKSLILGG